MSDEQLPPPPPSEQDEPGEGEALDLTNPEVERKFKRRKMRVAEEQREFYRRVFASRVGRRELWEILKATGWPEVKFACGPNGSPQSEATWFHLGERTLGERLYHTWLRLCPEGVGLMLHEHHPDFAKRGRK